MKFLCLCNYNAAQFAALTPEDIGKMMEACVPHDKALKASGHVEFVGSLGLPEQSRTLRASGTKGKADAGPFAETPDPIGAFFLVEASDLTEAVTIAALHPGAQLGDMFGGGIEVRPVENFEMI